MKTQTPTIQAGERTQTYTPGPWRFRKDDMGDYLHVEAKHPSTAGLPNATGYIVLATPAPHGNARRSEREANARLIGAAPDLLEAMQEMIAEARERNRSAGETVFNPAALEAGLAAVAKATGQSQQMSGS